MEDLLKKQTQQAFLELLQKKNLKHVTPKKLVDLAEIIYNLDMEMGTQAVMGIAVSKHTYYLWLKEVLDWIR